MDIPTSDIRFAISIRGTRSSTTKEMINSYCEKYGQINYSRCAFSPQGIMRGYNVVFKQEQSVNRFMDNRPHQIDGQSVKVKRCLPTNEEWKLTTSIIVTTSDSSTDKQIFQESTLRDYFSRYGLIRACRIETYRNRPCAYLTFTDYDRVDQLINDKPHLINKVVINIRKHTPTDNQTLRTPVKQIPKTPVKRPGFFSNDKNHSRSKQKRSTTNSSSNVNGKVQSEISTPVESTKRTKNDTEIFSLQNQYEHINTQIVNLCHEELVDDHRNELLHKLENDTQNLLQQIKNMQQKKKTFTDQLFEKYTIEYILSLNENDIHQRLEQLEKENQLLLLIKQNMPPMKPM